MQGSDGKRAQVVLVQPLVQRRRGVTLQPTHGRSTEAEVREILAVAVKPATRVRLGEALAALGRKIGLTNEDFEGFAASRRQGASRAVEI